MLWNVFEKYSIDSKNQIKIHMYTFLLDYKQFKFLLINVKQR